MTDSGLCIRLPVRGSPQALATVGVARDYVAGFICPLVAVAGQRPRFLGQPQTKGNVGEECLRRLATSPERDLMAVMIPNEPLDFHGSPGEEEAFNSLRALHERCYVFHSIRWLRRPGRGGTPEGEGDLIVFDPRRGALVIEVKSGGIRLHEGRWLQTNQATGIERPMQDPEAQANRTRWFLRERLIERFGASLACPVYHAVWFPSVDFPLGNLPLNYSASIILDRSALLDPIEAIENAFAFGSGRPATPQLNARDVKRVLELLAPSFSAAASMRHAIDGRDRSFVRLTQEQARVLDYLEDQSRAVVSGAAGTGKTMVALQLARVLADRGEDVTFLCFNNALKRFLEAHHGMRRVTFHTFDSLACSIAPAHAGNFDCARAALLDRLSSLNPPNLGHVLIDEGQDYEDDWIEVLDRATSQTFYVFYDRSQLVQRVRIPRWIEMAECRLVLRRNCRNTTQIARTAYRLGGLPLPPDTVSGPLPVLHACPDETAAGRRVARLVVNFLGKDELHPHEIALVSLRGTKESLLGEIQRVDRYRLTDTPTKDAIVWTTVRRFKGLEAKALILLDVVPRDLANDEVRRLLYVGASRATHDLHIVFSASDAEGIAAGTRALVGSGTRANAQALATFLGARWAKEEAYA